MAVVAVGVVATKMVDFLAAPSAVAEGPAAAAAAAAAAAGDSMDDDEDEEDSR